MLAIRLDLFALALTCLAVIILCAGMQPMPGRRAAWTLALIALVVVLARGLLTVR